MAIKTNLIHSGLPWTSPQKIAISSSQYISNTVINRSLLHLLNNDYYLDIKSQAINNYIEENIVSHISNQDIHVSWSRIQDLLSSLNILSEDTIYYIPLLFNNKEVPAAEINQLITKIPKNINGHTIVLYFCKAHSTENISNNTTIADINNKGILIQNFVGGDVIVYANSSTDILIDDYHDLSKLKAKPNTVSNIFETIQTYINKNTFDDSDNANRLTIKSTGINQNYATLSIKNCLANMYIINLCIQNTITNWNNIISQVLQIGLLPSINNVLLFYPLNSVSENKFPYTQRYLNKQFLNDNATYYLYTNSTITTNNGININSTNYINNNPVNPQYLSFDNFNSSEYLVSKELRKYIYNYQGLNDNFTITFIGKLDDILNSNNHPIFSDYNSIGNEFGLYVYLNKIYAANNTTKLDISQYITDFNINYTSIKNQHGMFVIQFVHDTSKIINSDIPTGITNIPITDGYMRVNILFYPINNITSENTISVLTPIILSPNAATINHTVSNSSFFKSVNYQFLTPNKTDYQNVPIAINLFANKRLANNNNSLKDWDYYSGYVKNIFLFRKILSGSEIQTLAKLGLTDTYDWISDIERQIIDNIGLSSYIGALNVSNNKNINLINTQLKTNG